MKRDLYQQLNLWKNDKNRKPLLLRGARQVGKTYLLKEFARLEYENTIYLDFDENPELDKFFTKDLNPNRIVKDLSIYFEQEILPQKTILIFDEIQESKHALNCLKYFNEQANQYHIVAAGSLLGVKLANNTGFPVGKITFMDLFPMSFFEFLSVTGKEQMRIALEEKQDIDNITEPIHNELINQLKNYYIVGGMPEVVKKYISTPSDFQSVRKIQNDILTAYELDFSKHTDPHETIKILKVWRSIPIQLAKENKKFIFSKIHKNARSREYIDAIEWLEHAGLILKSNNITAPKLPLEGYVKENTYKLFLLDIGLLGAISKLPPQIILEGNQMFSEFKGAFTENFVAGELFKANNFLYYWSIPQQAEINFLIFQNMNILPLEVKAGKGKKTKSLQIYSEKFTPKLLLRSSLRNFKRDNGFLNIPLYAISTLKNFTYNLC